MHFVSIVKSDEEDMTVEPGDMVVIQATRSGARFPAEIVQIIDRDLERFYRRNNIWPTTYDIEGCVERLAEKIHKQREVERLKKELRDKTKEIKQIKDCARKKSFTCTRYKPPQKQHIKLKTLEKGNFKCEPAPTTSCKQSPPILSGESTCKAVCDKRGCTFEAPSNSSSPCNTNSQYSLACSTNTDISLGNKLRICRSTSSTCSQEAGNSDTTSIETKNTGSGPGYSHITVSKERLPPVYGKCTPWRIPIKELKRRCQDHRNSLFTSIDRQ